MKNPAQVSATLAARLGGHFPEHGSIVAEARSQGAALVNRGDEWSVEVVVRDDAATVTATGASAGSRRALRNALIGRAQLLAEPAEHHVLGRVETRSPARRRDLGEAADLAARWARWLDTAVPRTPTGSATAPGLTPDEVAVYWWDERANFGDAVGPWLVRRISGAEPVNARRRRGLRPALYGVGSIIGLIDRNDVDVWGAGLMEPLGGAMLDNLRKRRNVRVHAVRGEHTRQELVSRLGWDVPEVYGDPALLLPLFYTPEPGQERGGVAVVPHYIHKKHLAGVAAPGVSVVDVARDLEHVIDRIATADACVSTSLHGAIIAQAYGVPWVWLRVEDQPLGGDAFKFGDFFSTLDESQVVRRDVAAADLATLDLAALGAEATLPSSRISLDALLQAFPWEVRPGAGEPFALPPLPRRSPWRVAADALRPGARAR